MQIAIATSLSAGAGFTHAKLSFEDWNAYAVGDDPLPGIELFLSVENAARAAEKGE